MKRIEKVLLVFLALAMFISVTPQVVLANDNITNRYEEVVDTQAIVKDAEVHVYTTKKAGIIELTDSNGIESTFTQGIGYREYTAIPEDGWVWKGWTYEQLFKGKDLGNRTDYGMGKRYSFSNDGSNWRTPYNGIGETISVNRLLTAGETTWNKIMYNIYANFNPTIRATAGVGGIITNEGIQEIEYGMDQSYTITADEGKKIASIVIDGETFFDGVGKKTFTYSFKNVIEPHEIEVYFTDELYTVTYMDGVEDEEIFTDEIYSDLKLGDFTPEFKGSLKREDYVFAGWNPQVEDYVKGDATYTATWKYAPEKYEVSYKFETSNASKNLPDAVLRQLPQSEEHIHGDVVIPPNIKNDLISVEDGVWVFKGWNIDQTIIDRENITIVGKWEFEAHRHVVNYAFQSTSNQKLPQEILALLPKEEVKDYGDKVIPPVLTQNRVEVSNGVWLFQEWTPKVVEKITEDCNFTGLWKYYPYQKILANDLSVYEGGLGSHLSIDTGDALPEPAWIGKSKKHTFTVEGKEWNIEKDGLPFVWKYLNQNKEEVTSSATVGEYTLNVYPKEELKGKDVIVDNQYILLLPEKGMQLSTIKVRDITNNDNANVLSSETFKNVYNYISPQSLEFLTSDFSSNESALDGAFDSTTGTHTDRCDIYEPHAHVQEGTTFFKNGDLDMPVENNEKIGLLWDDLLSDVLGSNDRMDMLHEKSLQVAKENFDRNGIIQREFKYIDLVDMTDGNVWVGTKEEDVTVYYPYPKGVSKDSEVVVTYYDGLTRDYTVDMNSSDLDKEIAQSNAHKVNHLRKTDTGILFDMPSKQFGPIEVIWQNSYTPMYEFVSEVENEPLPKEVMNVLSTIKDLNVVEGLSIIAPTLETKEVKVQDGIWKFQYWDSDQKVSQEGVKFIGTWKFFANAVAINEPPTISVKDKVIIVGDTFDPMKEVTASDKEDGDLSEQIEIINNTVDTTKVGVYTVTYKVTDKNGASTTKTITVTVKEKEEQPVLPTDPEENGNKDNSSDINNENISDTISLDKKENANTKITTSPETGDRATIILWNIIALISFAGVIIMLLLSKRKVLNRK